LPSDADAEKIEASYHSGVLTVTLPKRLEVQQEVKTIAIKSR
jgi:HSP20 family molecular chaperone IbpA